MKKSLICRALAGATLATGIALLSGCVVAPYGYGYDAYGNAYPAYSSNYGYGYAPAPVAVQPSIGIGLNYSRGYYGGGDEGRGYGRHGYWGHRGEGDHDGRR
jgi:hypothetical protein